MRRIGLGIFTLVLLGAFCGGVYTLADSAAFKTAVAQVYAVATVGADDLMAEATGDDFDLDGMFGDADSAAHEDAAPTPRPREFSPTGGKRGSAKHLRVVTE